ncbi:hypothetical protein ANANG_G00186320, partial [Anguilla anguilla]
SVLNVSVLRLCVSVLRRCLGYRTPHYSVIEIPEIPSNETAHPPITRQCSGSRGSKAHVQSSHHTTFYFADAFIQSDVHYVHTEGHRNNNVTEPVR